MESDLPKVLYPVGGRPMIEWVLDALEKVDVARVLLVVGYRSDLVREMLAHRSGIEFVEQTERLGTGHAVKICRDRLADHSGAVLIVTGDSPLIQPTSIKALFDVSFRELVTPKIISILFVLTLILIGFAALASIVIGVSDIARSGSRAPPSGRPRAHRS